MEEARRDEADLTSYNDTSTKTPPITAATSPQHGSAGPKGMSPHHSSDPTKMITQHGSDHDLGSKRKKTHDDSDSDSGCKRKCTSSPDEMQEILPQHSAIATKKLEQIATGTINKTEGTEAECSEARSLSDRTAQVPCESKPRLEFLYRKKGHRQVLAKHAESCNQRIYEEFKGVCPSLSPLVMKERAKLIRTLLGCPMDMISENPSVPLSSQDATIREDIFERFCHITAMESNSNVFTASSQEFKHFVKSAFLEARIGLVRELYSEEEPCTDVDYDRRSIKPPRYLVDNKETKSRQTGHLASIPSPINPEEDVSNDF